MADVKNLSSQDSILLSFNNSRAPRSIRWEYFLPFLNSSLPFASQAEVDTGTSTDTIVNPATLKVVTDTKSDKYVDNFLDAADDPTITFNETSGRITWYFPTVPIDDIVSITLFNSFISLDTIFISTLTSWGASDVDPTTITYYPTSEVVANGQYNFQLKNTSGSITDITFTLYFKIDGK